MNNLFNFTKGDIANNYCEPEEAGFPIQGNVQNIINTDVKKLQSIDNGILVNVRNKTKRDPKAIQNQPDTPLIGCKKSVRQSELAPFYPNGTPNNVISPNCDLMLGNVGSPTLYGETTFGVNNPKILNNPNNNIGHEIETYGRANQNGSRALSQGKNSSSVLLPGHNYPKLANKEINGEYIVEPVPCPGMDKLYQVGDWTKITPNFLSNFNNSQ